MAKRFEAAEKRLFQNVFICMKCNARHRLKDPKKAKCRKCGYKGFRAKHKDVKS